MLDLDLILDRVAMVLLAPIMLPLAVVYVVWVSLFER